MLALLVGWNCKPKPIDLPVEPDAVPTFSVNYRVYDIYRALNDWRGWAFLTDEAGTVREAQELVAGKNHRLELYETLSGSLDFTKIELSANSSQTDAQTVTLETITRVSSGAQLSIPRFKTRVRPSAGITIHHVPDDLEIVEIPRYSGTFSQEHDAESDILQINFSSGFILENNLLIKLKRASESFSRGAFLQLIGDGQPVILDYSDLDLTFIQKEISLPYADTWEPSIVGVWDDLLEQRVLIAGRQPDGSTETLESILVEIPESSPVSFYRLDLQAVREPARTDAMAFYQSYTQLPDQIEFEPLELAGQANGNTVMLTQTEQLDVIRLEFYAKIDVHRVYWTVYLDPASTDQYTLPDLPPAVLEQYPFLQDLEFADPVQVSGLKYLKDGGYQTQVYNYLNWGDDAYWEWELGLLESSRVLD